MIRRSVWDSGRWKGLPPELAGLLESVIRDSGLPLGSEESIWSLAQAKAASQDQRNDGSAL